MRSPNTPSGVSVDAAILLDAAAPGTRPVPLPGARGVRGRPGLYGAAGCNGQILGRRVPGGWLVVEASGMSVRERVLAHLLAHLAH